jgi:hypothetical protein
VSGRFAKNRPLVVCRVLRDLRAGESQRRPRARLRGGDLGRENVSDLGAVLAGDAGGRRTPRKSRPSSTRRGSRSRISASPSRPRSAPTSLICPTSISSQPRGIMGWDGRGVDDARPRLPVAKATRPPGADRAVRAQCCRQVLESAVGRRFHEQLLCLRGSGGAFCISPSRCQLPPSGEKSERSSSRGWDWIPRPPEILMG